MKKLQTLATAIAISLSGAAAAAPITVDFTDPGSLNVTSASLVTMENGVTDFNTYYYDPLTLDLGQGLEMSVGATAYDNNGVELANNGGRVVYYENSNPTSGLGVTSVVRHTGPLGTEYVTDNGQDGSIDIDSYLSLDNGNDALTFSFNEVVDFNSITLYYFGGFDDRAELSVISGADIGKVFDLKCTSSCIGADFGEREYNFDSMTGNSFELIATDKHVDGILGSYDVHATEFRLAGIGIDYSPQAVPEPGSIALLAAGLIGLAISRKRIAK